MPVTQPETSGGAKLGQQCLVADSVNSWYGCESRLLVKNSFVHFVFGPIEKRSQSVPPRLKFCQSTCLDKKTDDARWCDVVDDESLGEVSTCPGTPYGSASDASDSEGAHSSLPVPAPLASVATTSRLGSLRAAGDAVIHALGEMDPKQGRSKVQLNQADEHAVWSQPSFGCGIQGFTSHGTFESLSFPPGNFANVCTLSSCPQLPPGKFV